MRNAVNTERNATRRCTLIFTRQITPNLLYLRDSVALFTYLLTSLFWGKGGFRPRSLHNTRAGRGQVQT